MNTIRTKWKTTYASSFDLVTYNDQDGFVVVGFFPPMGAVLCSFDYVSYLFIDSELCCLYVCLMFYM